MTDPTPQAGQCKCGHHINFHSTMRRLDCLTYGCSCAAFTPAEPSPAPPVEDDFEHDPDCCCSLDNVPHSKDCRNCECQPRKGCDLAPSGWRCTRLSGHRGPCAAERVLIADDEKDYAELIAELVALREERDRARAALREAREFIENQQLPDGEWSRVLDLIVAALKPVSDRQPEGDLTLTQRLAARVGYTGPLAPETVDEVAKEEQQQTRQPEGETK